MNLEAVTMRTEGQGQSLQHALGKSFQVTQDSKWDSLSSQA
jgi:hypothetical protein